jgi:hypothetical protein
MPASSCPLKPACKSALLKASRVQAKLRWPGEARHGDTCRVAQQCLTCGDATALDQSPALLFPSGFDRRSARLAVLRSVLGPRLNSRGGVSSPNFRRNAARTGSQTAIAFWAYFRVTHSPRVGNGWDRLKNGARATRPQVDFDDDALLASEPRALRESTSKSSAYQVHHNWHGCQKPEAAVAQVVN